MTTHVMKSFNPMGERYDFDFGACTYNNGFFQIDTYQDASYFGMWTNPDTRRTITFAEGDITNEVSETPAEYRANLVKKLIYFEHGNREAYPHAMIDLGVRERDVRRDKFIRLGMASYIY